jgi:hypothetical protein
VLIDGLLSLGDLLARGVARSVALMVEGHPSTLSGPSPAPSLIIGGCAVARSCNTPNSAETIDQREGDDGRGYATTGNAICWLVSCAIPTSDLLPAQQGISIVFPNPRRRVRSWRIGDARDEEAAF